MLPSWAPPPSTRGLRTCNVGLCPGSLSEEQDQETFQNLQTFRVIIWLERRAARVLLRCSWCGRGMEAAEIGQQGENEYQSPQTPAPLSQSRGRHPTHSLSPFPSLTGGAFCWKGLGPVWISWCLVDLGACYLAMLVDPSASQQTTCPRSPLLSYSLLNKRRVPVALSCPPARSPTLPSPPPDLYPTLPWS